MREIPWCSGVLPVLLALAACGAGAGNPPPLAGGSTLARPPAPPVQRWLWGVTTDAPAVDTAGQVAALSALPARMTVRCVFDLPEPAAHYLPSVRSLAGVAEVLGLPIDSSRMASLDLAGVQARIADYLGTLGDAVSIWEVGNEVNGDWLGPAVVAKVAAMYDAVKAAGRPAALTFYYENPATPGHDLLPWIDANIPAGHAMRAGLDYALVSYYEDQNGGHQLAPAELDSLFRGLSARFPNAKVGFGEFGWGGAPPASAADRAELFRRFWGYRVPTVPAYVGGGFYWEFRQTMVPRSRPDWAVLRALEAP